MAVVRMIELAGASRGPVGGHLAHLLVPMAVLVVVLVVIVVDRVAGNPERNAEDGARTDEELPTGSVHFANAVARPISMATWPPPRSGARTRPASIDAARVAAIKTAVSASLAAAAIHFLVLPEHLAESALYGAFFIGVATVQLVFAAVLMYWPEPRLLKTAAWASVAVILVWLWTRTVGIPLGPGAGEVEPVNALDLLATAAEAVFAVACAIAVRKAGGRTARRGAMIERERGSGQPHQRECV